MKKTKKEIKDSFIEVVRKELKLSPSEFYNMLGMSRFLYSYYKRGKRAMSGDVMKRVMRACDGLLTDRQRNNILRQFFDS